MHGTLRTTGVALLGRGEKERYLMFFSEHS